jgi:hypothetical protein
MKSSTTKYEDQLNYIYEKLEEFNNGHYTLMGIELNNGSAKCL